VLSSGNTTTNIYIKTVQFIKTLRERDTVVTQAFGELHFTIFLSYFYIAKDSLLLFSKRVISNSSIILAMWLTLAVMS